jgi:hypothetical protein
MGLTSVADAKQITYRLRNTTDGSYFAVGNFVTNGTNDQSVPPLVAREYMDEGETVQPWIWNNTDTTSIDIDSSARTFFEVEYLGSW